MSKLSHYINEALDTQKRFSDEVVHVAMNDLGISEKAFGTLDKLIEVVKNIVNSVEVSKIIETNKDKRIELVAELIYDRVSNQIKIAMK